MSDSDDKGTQEQAGSEGSNNQSNQTGSSAAEYVSVTEFNKLQSQFEALRRSQQSEKDKAVKQVNQRVDGLEGDIRTMLQSALQKGQNISDVISEMDLQEERESRQAMLEMSRAFKEGRFSVGSSGGSGQPNGVNVDAVISELELDPNDVRVKEFRSRTFKSEADAALQGAKLLKSIQTHQPSDADTHTSKEAGSSETASKQEQLNQEYKDGAAQLRGQALLNFKREMRKKGWQGS